MAPMRAQANIAKAADFLSAVQPRHYREDSFIHSLQGAMAYSLAVAGLELVAARMFGPSQELVQRYADSLLHELWDNHADFAETAKAFSTDDETRAEGGELGWFALSQLPSDFAQAVAGWTTPGEIRGPVKSRFGFHVLKLLDYQPEKTLTLGADYDQIKEMARQDKTGRIVDQWIDEIKSHSYIDYRIEDLK